VSTPVPLRGTRGFEYRTSTTNKKPAERRTFCLAEREG
jgi:hypothetical protein